jgi:TonB-linked SusC/RagA family outer membrane protein
MKSNYFLILFLMLFGFGYSQDITITGVVKEAASGLSIPGANVQIKNSDIGTTTDLDGNFSIKGLSVNQVLVFSYLGFGDYEYTVVETKTGVSIALAETASTLEEVVVIGYGSQRKKDVTGSVSIIGSETLEALKPVNAEQAIQGRASGVLITSQGGSPGGGFNVSIRGIASNINNKPLYLVDGNIVQDLGLLNPQDIESYTILKDAQAAIYGTIGANGVIIITTKKGKKNTAATFTYNAYTGFQETSRKLPLLNATEYALLLNESYANGGNAVPYPDVSGLGQGTDWQDEIFNVAPIISHDLAVSGGSDKVTYMVSGSDLTQEGIIGGDKSHFKRNTARISLGAELTDKLNINTNFIYTYLDRDTFNDNALGSVLFNAVNAPPTLSVRDANGDFTLIPSTPGLGIEIINPSAQLANTYNDYDASRIAGSISIDYELIKNLVITSRLGVFQQHGQGKTFAKIVDYGGKVFDVQRSSVTQNSAKDNSYTLDIFANYKNTFGEHHNFEFMLGTSSNKEWGNGLFATGYDVPNNSWQFADIALANGLGTAVPVSSYNYDNRRNAYFVRLQYNFDEKYLVSFMYRRDASTYFGPNNSIAYFPSMTAGWVISKEGFYGENNFVNFLKIRGSYGLLGNDQIGANRYLGTLGGEATYVFDGQLVNGVAVGVLPNPDVTWEKSKKFDVGLDMNFWNDKIEVTSDYYINTTAGLLIEGYPVSGTSGIGAPGSGAPTVNAGTTRNQGIEVSVDYNEKLSDDFGFGLNFNVSTIDNEVIDIEGDNLFVEQGAFGVGQPLRPTRMEEGQSLGYFYGFKTDGIFQNQAEVDAHPSQAALGAEAAPGDIRFKDLDGDGVITPLDRTNLGDAIPDMTLGFNLNINYKSFDLAAYSYASIGNDLIRNYERVLSDVNRLDYNLDRWTGEGTSTTVPRVTTAATSNNVFSDYYVEDASFLRIQKLELGYTINKSFTQRAKIDRVRVYASANNLYTFTNYKGYDPAARTASPIAGGIDNGTYPLARTYMFGINLNF